MTNALQFVTPPNPTVTPAAGPAPVEPVRQEKPVKIDAPATDLRLIIEEDENGKGFIYKTLDRRTGEILQVYPRDDLLKLKDTEGYKPGVVVDQRT